MISRPFIRAIIRAPAAKRSAFQQNTIINVAPASMTITSRGIVRSYANQASAASGTASSTSVWQTLYGLHGLNSDSKFTLQLVSSLVPQIESASEQLSAAELSRAVQSLHLLSSDQPEVRQLVAALVPKVKACQQSFRASDVGAALSGLQRLSNKYPEVSDLVSALSLKVEACRNKIDFSNLSVALFGLRNMTYNDSSAEFRRFVDWLILVTINRVQQDGEGPRILPSDLTLAASVRRSLQALMDAPAFSSAAWRDDVQELIDLLHSLSKPI